MDPLSCEIYFEELLNRYAISTLRRHFATLRGAYGYAVRHDLVARDPTADVRLPRLPDVEPQTYSNDELRQILAAVRDEREQRMVYLFAFAGLRLSEAAELRWKNVEFETAQIKVLGKGGKLRIVPLHPALGRLLSEHERRASADAMYVVESNRGERLADATWGGILRALTDRASVKTGAPSHTFRKTVATAMYEEGVRAATIDRIMGWAPRTVRERHYIRIAPKTMHDAIQTLYADDPICPEQRATIAPRATQPPHATADRWRRDAQRLVAIEQRLAATSS